LRKFRVELVVMSWC